MNKFQPIPYEKILAQALKDPDFKKEYDALEVEYNIIKQVIVKGLEKGLTQKQLADKAGTKQSAISRLEGGNSNLTLAFLNKVAKALDTHICISLQ